MPVGYISKNERENSGASDSSRDNLISSLGKNPNMEKLKMLKKGRLAESPVSLVFYCLLIKNDQQDMKIPFFDIGFRI